MSAPTQSSITQFLQSDHHDLDQLFADACAMVKAGDWASAELGTIRFSRALREHIIMEEELLFPLMQEHSDVSGPCTVMGREHAQIVRHLEDLYAAARDKSSAHFEETARRLQEVLRVHNSKEENILYPLADQLVGAYAEQLIQSMRTVRRPQGGCGGKGSGGCGCGHAA